MVNALPFIRQPDRVEQKTSDVLATYWRYQTQKNLLQIYTCAVAVFLRAGNLEKEFQENGVSNCIDLDNEDIITLNCKDTKPILVIILTCSPVPGGSSDHQDYVMYPSLRSLYQTH